MSAAFSFLIYCVSLKFIVKNETVSRIAAGTQPASVNILDVQYINGERKVRWNYDLSKYICSLKN